jgi:hypothetical protein
MAKLNYRALERNMHPELDLFTWAAERERKHRCSVAARILARRHNITEARATLVCEIAGIGRGAE